MDLIAMAGHAMELKIKVLELAELQVHYKKCICGNVQLVEQKMKWQTRVQHMENNIYTLSKFQEQQSSLLKHIMGMHKENARLSMAVHDLEH